MVNMRDFQRLLFSLRLTNHAYERYIERTPQILHKKPKNVRKECARAFYKKFKNGAQIDSQSGIHVQLYDNLNFIVKPGETGGWIILTFYRPDSERDFEGKVADLL